MRLLLAILLALASRGEAAPVFGSDYASTAAITTSSLTVTAATLGSTGANSILIVVLETGADYNTPAVVDYNGVGLTSLGGKVTYSGGSTQYRQFWYLNANLTSGQDIHVFSAATGTDLGGGGSQSWHIRYWTYSSVNGIGTTSINASNFTTSASPSPVTTAFNFTPSVSTSTILQLLIIQGNTCATTYAPATGTIRQAITTAFFGANAMGIAFSGYAPGSASLYSLSQDWTPASCSETGYGLGIELLDSGAAPTPTPGAGPPTGSQMMTGCGT